MNQDRTKRKLTAVFSADVVGYSKMMDTDEAWTIKSLEENKKLMSSLIDEHNGRVVDSPGDNLLAEFRSVINAVECAVKVQEQLNNKNSKLMEDNRMHFRIGVNLGDVVEEEDRIYGNGVNIAARLEGLAEPGGICISGTAYDQVKSKVNVEYDYLGEYEVKNIEEPIRVYRILLEGVSPEKHVPHKVKKRINPLSITIAIIILLVVALGTTITILYPKPSETDQVTRFSMELPEGQQFSDLRNPSITISPNGKHIVYSTLEGLYLRSTDEFTAKIIAGTEGSTAHPFFSPDSEWIGYFSVSEGKMKKIDINGGPPVTLCDKAIVGAHWITDSTIIFGQYPGDIMQVSSNGGAPDTFIETGYMMSFLPQMLPDGKTVLFTVMPQRKIVVQSIESGEKKELFSGFGGKYVSTGHIVYNLENNSNSLFAVPFDLEKLEVTGSATPIVEDVISTYNCAFSDSGTLVYISGKINFVLSNQYNLVWVDREGKEELLSIEPNNYVFPRVSPDKSKIALVINTDDGFDIWIWDIVREISTRLTFDGRSGAPLWTPDSDRIVFLKTGDLDTLESAIYWKAADGTGEEEKLTSASDRVFIPWSWSIDGNILAMNMMYSLEALDIGLLSMEGEHERKELLSEDYIEFQPAISPDGNWLAYTSNEFGQREIFVRPFPDVNQGIWQVSNSGGDTPLWSPDGNELFYLRENSVIRVTVDTDPTFKSGKPEVLFKSNYLMFSFRDLRPWDISPDGKRFLMKKPTVTSDEETASEVSRRINVVLNWFEELKERVPVD